MTDDANAARPRRAPRRPTRRVERASEPLAEAVPEPWMETAQDEIGDDWTAEELAVDAPTVPAGINTDTDGAPPIVPDASIWLPLLEGRSPDAMICPFLRSVGPGDAIGFPVEAPDVTNRCAALRDPVPQSLRQQELVCLTRAHVDCPRYLRGAVVATEVPSAAVHGRTQVTPAIAASLIILGLSFAASVAFGLANGGLLLPSSLTSPGPTSSAAVVDPSPTPEPSVGATPTAVVTPTIEPSASASTEPTPVVTPTPVPTATTEPTAKPTSDRYDLLKPCPNKPDCYIYKIRSGDNLFSISNYFGIPLSTVKALNPWTKTQSLRAGKELILPPPTR